MPMSYTISVFYGRHDVKKIVEQSLNPTLHKPTASLVTPTASGLPVGCVGVTVTYRHERTQNS